MYHMCVATRSTPPLAMSAFTLDTGECHAALEGLQKCVSINTVSGSGPDGGYDEFVAWLQKEMQKNGVERCWVLPESLPGKPILVATILGTKPELPQVLLNAHYDVVPVVQSEWTVPAFEGLRKDGKVYGRGTQDMKCALMGYVYSIKKLLSIGFAPTRTIHLSFVRILFHVLPSFSCL